MSSGKCYKTPCFTPFISQASGNLSCQLFDDMGGAPLKENAELLQIKSAWSLNCFDCLFEKSIFNSVYVNFFFVLIWGDILLSAMGQSTYIVSCL